MEFLYFHQSMGLESSNQSSSLSCRASTSHRFSHFLRHNHHCNHQAPAMAAFIFKSLSHPPPLLLIRHRYHLRHIRQKISFSPIPAISTSTLTSRLLHGWNWRMKKVLQLGGAKESVSGDRKWISGGNINGHDRRKQGILRPQATVRSAFDNNRRTEEVEEREMESSHGTVGCSGDGKEKEEESRGSKLMTPPTVLTLGRVAAVPLLVSTFYLDTWWSETATTSIFLAAAVTDWLDGYLARKMHLGTAFGAFLDPVADKLMVAATLVLLCTRPLETSMFGQAQWILSIPSIAIIGREITMSAVREWAASQDSSLLEAVAVNNLGKWKTATQMTALTILLATRDASLKGADGLVASGVILLYISAWLAVWSLVVYTKKIWRVMLR